MKLLPIIITRSHKWTRDGYTFLWQRGAITWTTRRENGVVSGFSDTSGVTLQVWIANWLYDLPSMPVEAWMRLRHRLIDSKVEEAYERGHSNGVREAYYSPEQFDHLTIEEKAGLMQLTPEQVRNHEKRKQRA